jgi:hypothetical protein
MAEARNFAIVTSPVARAALSRLFKPHLPETPVLSFLEIPGRQAGRGVRGRRRQRQGAAAPRSGARSAGHTA